ncbi:hypothetical protein Nepgr_031307 [Nepenthes gracilis]|uniref:Transmembrane protein n=1 Tax=Nepenthes gracilis TaxID=150966 RepID=A0AAD3TI16_NEPGR|nr:hypothetical protein Nepgr_031307 [Nepenthes gracilis]
MRLLAFLALWVVLLAAPVCGGFEKKKSLGFLCGFFGSIMYPHLLILVPVWWWYPCLLSVTWCLGVPFVHDVVGEDSACFDGELGCAAWTRLVVSLPDESPWFGCVMVSVVGSLGIVNGVTLALFPFGWGCVVVLESPCRFDGDWAGRRLPWPEALEYGGASWSRLYGRSS